MSEKTYIELPNVADFLRTQPDEVLAEYGALVELPEDRGRLVSPFAEKVEPGLFAIRPRHTRNVRVFYVYVGEDAIHGIHAYEKRSQKIPKRELDRARRTMRALR